MRIHFIALAGFLVLLYGCSGFALQSGKKTFTTEAISASSYSVSFCGNAYMNQDKAEKFAMQRACEITLTKGFTHFAVLTKSDQSEFCLLKDAPRSGSMDATAAGSFTGPQSIVRPNITLKIQCYSAKDAPKDAIEAQKYLDENFPGLKF